MEASYLSRIGVPGAPEEWGPEPAATAGERLRRLADAHLATVPFENLALHAGEVVSVQPSMILAKILGRQRGGICYELNGSLGWLLGRLGWSVAYHAGRIRGPDGGYGLPLGHLALIVGEPTTPERWLVDVGFGGDLLFGPVAEVVSGVDGPEAEAVVRDLGGRSAGYLLETRHRPLRDFAGMAWWHSSSPEARFSGSLVCSITRGATRTTLSGRRLKITEGGEVVRERNLVDAREVLAVYRATFGIELDAEPVQRQFVANGSPR